MKGVWRQRNTGCILALIMSRMMLMMLWSHPYQHQTGRALRQRNGGCRRVPEAGNDLHQEHYSVKLYITKSFFMKGVLRQRNTGCILAFSVSRTMIMNTISSSSSPKRADTLAKERRGASKDLPGASPATAFQKSARSGERLAPGALFILIDSD